MASEVPGLDNDVRVASPASGSGVAIIGVDFTSRPSRRKPITVARGRLSGDMLSVSAVDRLPSLEAFAQLLQERGPWVGAFDFPFGLPRELIEKLRWPGAGTRTRRYWPKLIRHYAALDRQQVAIVFDRFRARRPAGRKYAHRETEALARAHASMKLVNPPVGWMLHQGAPALLNAGVHIPGIRVGDQSRVALEAYPGFLLRLVTTRWGERRTPPYKSDAPGRRRPAHRECRVRLLWALVEGEHPLTIKLDLPVGLAAAAIDDGTGDTLDALAAAVQAAWAASRSDANYGLPRGFDPLEGWIIGAGELDDDRAQAAAHSRRPLRPSRRRRTAKSG